MKKNGIFSLIIFLFAGLMMISSCSKDKDTTPNPNPDPDPSETTAKYVLITMSEQTLTKPGFITAFDALPEGDIVNNDAQSLQGLGFGGWRPYKNDLFKMFSMESNALGIEKLKVDAAGKITSAGFIAGDNTTNGTGNFVIVDDENGFYWDGASPMEIQTFNPTTMKRTGSTDYTEVVNQIGEDEASIKFRSIGQKFLAVKEGKLYANITYAKTDEAQKGFWDDFYPDVYIAVIDAKTGDYEKTITIEETGSIAYINDNNMYDFDTNGDLYIVTQGRSAVGGESKISRIKAGESDIDPSWSLDMDDIQEGGKFVSVFVKEGQLITLIPTEPLTGGPNGNINFSDVWEFYSIDVATKQRTKIEGVPTVINPGAAFAAIEVDDKVLLRVTTEDGSINGYYELDGTSASPVFNVTAGGSVQGLHKVEIEE